MRAVGAPPPPFEGVTTPVAVAPRLDPADYLGALRHPYPHGDFDDDGLA